MMLDLLFILFSTFLLVICFFVFAMIMKTISQSFLEQYYSAIDLRVKLIINEYAHQNLWLVDATKKILKNNLRKMYRRNLMVIICISNKVELDNYGSVKGYIVHEHTKYDNVFTINLNAELSPKLMLTTLCHELSHLIQYAEGRHRVYRYNNVTYEMWNGVNYGPKDSIKYSNRPWEIEALAMENKFIDDYYQTTK